MALQSRHDFLAKLASEECPICYEVLIAPIRTECGHLFCIECAKHWFESSHTCPACRQELFEGPEPDDEEDDEGDESDEYSPAWYAAQYAIWDPSAPRPRMLTALPYTWDVGDVTVYANLELLNPDEISFDIEDDVFRETLMDLYFQCAPQVGDEEEEEAERLNQFWNMEPEWAGPTIVTSSHLQSQAKAALVRLTPCRYDLDLNGTATREALCWDGWAEVSRYLLTKLESLFKEKPEQSARALEDNLTKGWQDHLLAEEITMPQFDPRLSSDTWGTFEENVDRLFTRVVLFTQDTATRYWNALERSQGPQPLDHSERELPTAYENSYDDEDGSLHALGEHRDNYEDMYSRHEDRWRIIMPAAEASQTEPAGIVINNTESNSLGPNGMEQPFYSGCHVRDASQVVVLVTIEAEVKKHVVVRSLATYSAIVCALLAESVDCTSGHDLYQKTGEGPFPEELCDRVYEITRDQWLEG